ncbi:Uncharacterised protein [uncultured archaeon]|nr:Uncharacterised protein [uncultured archaeon]
MLINGTPVYIIEQGWTYDPAMKDPQTGRIVQQPWSQLLQANFILTPIGTWLDEDWHRDTVEFALYNSTDYKITMRPPQTQTNQNA